VKGVRIAEIFDGEGDREGGSGFKAVFSFSPMEFGPATLFI
jgi:hypothetical protein